MQSRLGDSHLTSGNTREDKRPKQSLGKKSRNHTGEPVPWLIIRALRSKSGRSSNKSINNIVWRRGEVPREPRIRATQECVSKHATSAVGEPGGRRGTGAISREGTRTQRIASTTMPLHQPLRILGLQRTVTSRYIMRMVCLNWTCGAPLAFAGVCNIKKPGDNHQPVGDSQHNSSVSSQLE